MDNVKDTYNKIADKYADLYFDDITDFPYVDKLLNLLNKGDRILDVGCGNGNFSKYIKSKGFTPIGIDISTEMLRIAHERIPDVEFLEQNMQNLTFEDESFDALLCAYSLIHIPSTELSETLAKLKRILKSKGKILIIVQEGKPDRVVDEPIMEGEKIFINFFTEDRLSTFLEGTGFNILSIETTKNHDSDSLSDRVIYVIAEKK